MQFIQTFDVLLERIKLIKMLTSSITLTLKCGFLKDTFFLLNSLLSLLYKNLKFIEYSFV